VKRHHGSMDHMAGIPWRNRYLDTVLAPRIHSTRGTCGVVHVRQERDRERKRETAKRLVLSQLIGAKWKRRIASNNQTNQQKVLIHLELKVFYRYFDRLTIKSKNVNVSR